MKEKLSRLFARFAFPGALMLLGAVLIVNPDSASALVSRGLGVLLLIGGVCFAVSAFLNPSGMVGRVLGAVLCFALGIWLLRNPLALARGTGRVVGILLALRGGQEFFSSQYTKGKLLSLSMMVLGVILALLPMTTSRVVFLLGGVVILAAGLAVLWERLHEDPPAIGSGKPDIIDEAP